MVNVYGLLILVKEDEEIPHLTLFLLASIVILEGCLV